MEMVSGSPLIAKEPGGLGKAAGKGDREETEGKRVRKMARISSLSEKPRSHRPRRLADWRNPEGTRKVHLLVDKVYKKKNLELAWKRVRQNRGADGVDRQSIEEFEENMELELDRLNEELRSETYRPRPVRQHMIPKSGQPGKYRHWAYRRFTIGFVSRHCSTGWSRSLNRYSMRSTSDTDGDGRLRMHFGRSGGNCKGDASG
jgi:hypothetical protein